MKTITVPPEQYGLQTIADMKRVFESVGYKKPYSPYFIHDAANTIAYWQLGLMPVFRQIEDGTTEEGMYFMNLKKFLSAIDPSKVTGNSPIQKAAYLQMGMDNEEMLQTPSPTNPEEEEEQNQPEQEEEEEEEEEEEDTDAPDFDFTEDDNAVVDGTNIKAFAPSDDNKGNTQADPEALVIRMQQNMMERRDFAGTVAAEYTKVDGKIPEAMVLPKKVKTIVDHVSILKSRKKIRSVRFPDQTTISSIQKYSQISKVASFSSIIHPLFDLRFAQKQIQVRERKVKGAQDVIFLIDASASMNTPDKTAWIRALLLDRYQEVIEGKSRLVVVPYEGAIFEKVAICVHVAEDVKKHMNWFPRFNIGNTDIEKSVRETIRAIKAGKLGGCEFEGQHPEIVVICDGDDYVSPNFKPGYPIHAFILGQHNPGVKMMCESSGGTYEIFYVGEKK